MDFLKKVYEKSDDIVSRKIADDYILVPVKRNVADMESLYTLNETAARIWELIDGKRTVTEIKEKMIEDYEVTSEEAEGDLIEHLQQLAEIKAIIER